MTTPRKGASKYERRAARQRQLDQMEAAASGTSADMELDTGSVETEGRFVSMRQRNQETARRFLHDEDEAVLTTSTVKNTTTANLFGARGENPDLNAVNLMDHETGVYSREDTSFSGRLKRFFFGPSEPQGPMEHDAIAADSDIYLGEQRASRTSSTFVRLRYLLCSSKQRVIMAFGVFVIMFLVTFFSLRSKSYHGPTPEQILRSQNSERFNEIMDYIVLESFADPKTFLQSKSPQSRALRWIAYSDRAKLDPQDPMILQRYALVAFFYNSFASFEAATGKQKPIETEDDQFEGVPIVGWRNQEYWLSNRGFCEWHGVECEIRDVNGIQVRQYNDNAPIYALNLTNNYVWGTIPFEIKAFQTMERFDLSNNRLSGQFPPEVRHMTKLRYLNLAHNRMTGEIPPDFGHMQGVIDLDLSRNKFTGALPTELNRLSNVRVLDLSQNQLSGQIPMIKGLASLHYLYLADNKFSGTVPFTLAEVSQLREVYLEKNRFSGTIAPEIEGLRNLRVFSAYENEMTGHFPNGMFYTNIELTEVNVQHNKFSGSLPSKAGKLTALHILKMNDNKFDGTFPTEWVHMPSLEVLHLQNNHLRGSIPSTIGTLKALKELWLTNNTMNGEIPPEFHGCSALEDAYLEHNMFKHQLPSEVGQMKKLQTLRLEYNLFVGTIHQKVCDLKTFDRLKFLSVDCKVHCTCCDKCYN